MTSIVTEGSDTIDMAIAARLQEPGTLVLEDHLRGAAGRCARVSAYESGPTLMLEIDVENGAKPGAPGHYARSLVLRLALGPPASCTLDGRWCGGVHAWHGGWDLTVNDAHDAGPFEEACWWVDRELWGEELVEMDSTLCCDEGDPREHPGAKRVRRRMSEISETVSDRAIVMCDSAAREGALRLSRDARFFAYALLVADRSGRVAQMVDVCPGLFAIAALTPPRSTTAYQLLAAIQSGRKVSELLDLLLPRAEELVAARSTSALSSAAKALVRRAPPMRGHDLLEALQAPGIDVNDLARANELSREWFDVMKAWTRRARSIAGGTQRTNIGGFLSKHAVAIAQTTHAEAFIDEMMDWLECTGSTAPTRITSLARVRRAIDAWHATVYRDVAHDPETPLAAGPRSIRDVAGIEVCAIETVGELIAEGDRMHHCVAAFADAAIAGQVYFYRAVIHRERVTIALAGRPKQWHLREASGFANRRLDPTETAVLYRWLEALP